MNCFLMSRTLLEELRLVREISQKQSCQRKTDCRLEIMHGIRTREAAEYAIEQIEDIMRIPDLRVAFSLLKKFDLSTRNIQSLEEAKQRLLEYFQTDAEGAKQGLTFGWLKKALEEDRVKREKLIEFFGKVEDFFFRLPRNFQQNLNQIFTDINSSFASRAAELRTQECTILVAGETTAGKSTLINLLLGMDLLPTSQLSCTATICEIRTSTIGCKEAVAYFKSVYEDGQKLGKRPPVRVDLGDSQGRGIKELKQFLVETDTYGESPYSKVEIYWPIPLLEEGMVIVDTPGIGGIGRMAKYVTHYLEKSFGFIYVVNSSNAGGIQKGRLQDFLRTVVSSAGEEGFNPEASLFVVNKWDVIPQTDKDALKTDIVNKLKKIYSGFKEDQICYISMTEAIQALQYHTQTEEHKDLSTAIGRLLPDSLANRLNTHYRWLSAVLKRSMYSLKVSRVMTDQTRTKIQEKRQQVRRQMDVIERNTEENMAHMKRYIASDTDLITKKIVDALRSRDMQTKLIEWQPHQCPTVSDWKQFLKEAENTIANRVALIVNKWDRENGIVAGFKEKIIKTFKREFELMEDQITKCEGLLLDGENLVVTDLHKSIKREMQVKDIFKERMLGQGSEDEHMYKGLGGVISNLGYLEQTKSRKNGGLMFSTSKKKPAEERMKEATELFINNIFQNKSLGTEVGKFFKKYIKGVDAIAKMIPNFLRADKQLMEDLSQEMRGHEKNLESLFPQLISECYTIQGKLDLFFINNIMKYDYMMEDLLWNPEERPLGSGSFADVYRGKIRRINRQPNQAERQITVALKVTKDPLRESTVSDILLEDRTLRDLSHENIVKYYGATYTMLQRNKKYPLEPHWIMILEMCQHSLKEEYIGEASIAPGKVTNASSRFRAMQNMTRHALQICTGLDYLHQKGFVHRDLKLENVLVSQDGVAKLTDVGVAKAKIYIAFTKAGSPVYMAPEVLISDRNHDCRADIYSLAIMLWEMWYGLDVADHISPLVATTLEKEVKKGLRPSMSLIHKPPMDLENLICCSWEDEPSKRPELSIHISVFQRFLMNP